MMVNRRFERELELLGFELSTAGLTKAVRLNRFYKKKLGWVKDEDRIIKLLGIHTGSTETVFAEAVARWQKRKGLTDDGIIGPDTWSIMNEAFASLATPSPTNGTSPFSGFGCDYLWNEQKRWTRVKMKIVEIAEDEYVNIWNAGRRRESEKYWSQGVYVHMIDIIKKYWSQGVYEGGSVPQHIRIPESAWSAAFIAWVVGQAGGGDRFSKVGMEPSYRLRPWPGAGPGDNFRPAAHWRYVAPAKINRVNNEPNPFRAFEAREIKPQLGDIVVKSRAGSGVTYDRIKNSGKLGGKRLTHGDIVVEVMPDNIKVIGGNVRNSVRKLEVDLDANGFIESTGGTNNDHFAIVRIVTDIFDKDPSCFVPKSFLPGVKY